METKNKELSFVDYQKSLATKQIGTAVIFFNEQGEILVLKPNYKKGWLVPGGATDDGESPITCAIRETYEEIHIKISDPKLLAVYFSAAKNGFGDSLKFIFSGGILTSSDIEKIKIQKSEIDEFKFLPLNKALSLLSNSLKNSIPEAIGAIETGSVVFID